MEYNINIRNWGRVFTVPCSVTDEYLKEADGNYLKVLLCVLSWGGCKLSDEKISSITGLDSNTIREALHYWNNKEVISVNFSSDDFVGFSPEPLINEVRTPQISSNPTIRNERTENVAYTVTEMAQIISENSDLKMFFDNVQAVLGRTVNHTEQRGFIYIYEFYGLDTPSMLLIVDYCVKMGKSNLAYIKSVAKGFFEKNITTYSEIEKEIIRINDYYKYENRIASAFGITTKLTTNQKKYIDTWKEMNIPVDLAELAYEKCVDNNGKMGFAYINKILCNWHSEGINTVEAANNAALSRKKQYEASEKHSYDINEIDEFQKNFLLNRKNVKL